MTQHAPGENEKIIAFEADGLTLAGTLHHPGTPNPPLVAGCHGLFADRSSPKQAALARAACRAGLAFFRLDHRGCGDSQGVFKEVTTLENRVRDLEAAVAMLRKDHGLTGPLGLFGSSLGGTVCLASALKSPVDCLVTNAAPVDLAAVSHVLRESGQDHLVSPELGEAPSVLEPAGGRSISRILIFHGALDETVPVSHAHALHEFCQEPKDLVIFPRGDHRMSDSRDQAAFVDRAVQWLQAHLLPGGRRAAGLF